MSVLRSLIAVIRFICGITFILLLSFAAHVILSESFRPIRSPMPFFERPGYWYLIPLAWAVLTTSGVLAILFDYPKFRPWRRFDKALLAGFLTVMVPLFLAGMKDQILYDDPYVPFFSARIRPFDGPDLNLAFGISLHVFIALILGSSRLFMPDRPALWPYGFLYRYVLFGVLIVPLHAYLSLIIGYAMGA